MPMDLYISDSNMHSNMIISQRKKITSKILVEMNNDQLNIFPSKRVNFS